MSQTPRRQGSLRAPLNAGSDRESSKIPVDATSRDCQQMAVSPAPLTESAKSSGDVNLLRHSKRKDDIIFANDEVCLEY